MKKYILGITFTLLGIMTFSSKASADIIEIDTTDVPSTQNITVDDDYIDIDSILIEMDDETYCISENKLVSSLANFKNAIEIKPRGTESWNTSLGNGGYHEKIIHTSKGQAVSYGSQPTNGGTATRNITLATGTHVYYNQTSNAGRMVYNFNSIGGQIRGRTTNYSSYTPYRIWFTY
ncbi:hypothetical protein [Enterococcus gilvus]|uniref:hypothetical protein n=1 Tax=Enterococcus gilvus TaxID=160453 RepID=UPI001C8BB611|nr:hypothetical protein [Enterococcus gilvus]MBX8938923.1 hypothetical protein [Enterococcus gilvus]